MGSERAKQPTVCCSAYLGLRQDVLTRTEMTALLRLDPVAHWLDIDPPPDDGTSWGREGQIAAEQPLAAHVTELLDLVEARPGALEQIANQPGFFGEMATNYYSSDDAFDDEPGYLPPDVIGRLAKHGLQLHIEHFGAWNWHRTDYDDWDENRPEFCHGFSVGVRVPAPTAKPGQWADPPIEALLDDAGALIVRLAEGPAEGPYPLVRRKLNLVLDALDARRDAWLALADAAEAVVECTYIGTGNEGGLLLCPRLIRRMAALRLGLSARFALTASFRHVRELPPEAEA